MLRPSWFSHKHSLRKILKNPSTRVEFGGHLVQGPVSSQMRGPPLFVSLGCSGDWGNPNSAWGNTVSCCLYRHVYSFSYTLKWKKYYNVFLLYCHLSIIHITALSWWPSRLVSEVRLMPRTPLSPCQMQPAVFQVNTGYLLRFQM